MIYVQLSDRLKFQRSVNYDGFSFIGSGPGLSLERRGVGHPMGAELKLCAVMTFARPCQIWIFLVNKLLAGSQIIRGGLGESLVVARIGILGESVL